MSRYLLDTTFNVDHLRGKAEAVQRLRGLVEHGDLPFVSDVVTAYAWAGAMTDDDPDLVPLQFLEFIAAGPEYARVAGRWQAQSRARGHDIATADGLIASCAADMRAAVITRNVGDFRKTPVELVAY